MSTSTVDIAVLGGGPAGYATALRATQLGLTVTLVEQDKVGGTCLHRGCVPTKALLHAAEIADGAREAQQFGVTADFGGVDAAKLQAFKASVVKRLYQGLTGLVDSRDVTVIHGRGELAGPNRIAVDGQTVQARNIVLATGSSPRLLPGIELTDRVLTSDQALELDFVPQSAIVLGGGVIGVEFASLWASFGAKVTIVEALPRLLAAEDPFISTAVERAFRRRRITNKTNASVTDVKSGPGGVTVTLAGGETYEAEVLLVATGRVPSLDADNLAAQGVDVDGGFVVTDERLQTSVPGIYAAGDIVRGPQLAHRGFQQGIFLAELIAGRNPRPVDPQGIPRVTYSHPEVASVGLTEAAARERHGDDITVGTHDLAGNARSLILKTAGAVKVITGPTGAVLGVHMVGDRVGELIGEGQLLYNLGIDAAEAARFVHAHPTQGEALGEALLAVTGAPFHAH
jgi:dihydrolipoamide dehydrogenase